MCQKILSSRYSFNCLKVEVKMMKQIQYFYRVKTHGIGHSLFTSSLSQFTCPLNSLTLVSFSFFTSLHSLFVLTIWSLYLVCALSLHFSNHNSQHNLPLYFLSLSLYPISMFSDLLSPAILLPYFSLNVMLHFLPLVSFYVSLPTFTSKIIN